MNITDKLLTLDPSLNRHNEGKWAEPLDRTDTGFTSFNDAGLECETGEFMYSMVRMLKPERVLETGTHWGVGSCYIALGLQENGFGYLDTLEFLLHIYDRAQERFAKTGLNQYINSMLEDATKWIPAAGSMYKLILLDTEPQTRFAELIRYFDYLEPGGFVFIHDLHSHMGQVDNADHGFAWPYGPLPEKIKTWVKNGIIRPFHFRTPRGFTGFYKVSDQDYKF